MDTFEKIRALLAEQLDVDPAKITMDRDRKSTRLNSSHSDRSRMPSSA